MKYCWKCGREMRDEAAYCSACGASMDVPEADGDSAITHRLGEKTWLRRAATVCLIAGTVGIVAIVGFGEYVRVNRSPVSGVNRAATQSSPATSAPAPASARTATVEPPLPSVPKEGAPEAEDPYQLHTPARNSSERKVILDACRAYLQYKGKFVVYRMAVTKERAIATIEGDPIGSTNTNTVFLSRCSSGWTGVYTDEDPECPSEQEWLFPQY